MGHRRSGFSLVELLVVIAIIVILLSAIIVAAQSVITKSKTRGTRTVLAVVQQAIEQFEREQKTNPTLVNARQARQGGGNVRYLDRYGRFPPDELEVFTAAGLPGSAAGGTLAPSGATLVYGGQPVNTFPPMQFYAYKGANWQQNAFEGRDLAAMILAIELYSDAATAILDNIPNSNRHEGVLDKNGDPVMFLDRNGDEKWNAGDLQIRYIVDSWGLQLSYLAEIGRDIDPDTGEPAPSSNLPSWNEASTDIIRLNRGQPVVFSYGPNGGEQFEKINMDPNGKDSLVGDWVGQNNSQRTRKIDDFLNADNVYANPELKTKLEAGIQVSR